MAIAVICALLVVLGRRDPRLRGLAVGAASVLIFLGATIAWRFLIHREIVSFDRLLGADWYYTLDGVKEHLVFFGPPALVTVLALVLLGKRLTPPARDDE